MKRIIKKIAPPFIIDLLRLFLPRKPMFCGVYQKSSDVPDQSPWVSAERLRYTQQKLTLLGSIYESKKIIPDPSFQGGMEILTLLINLLSCQARIRVLDFGGGNGVTYYGIFPFLTHPENVFWANCDSLPLLQQGEAYKKPCHNINFISSIPQGEVFDLLYINTSLQYIYDWKNCLDVLLKGKPKLILLTRLLAGEVETFFTKQVNIQGGTTAAMILNIHDVLSYFEQNQYELIFKSPAHEDVLTKEIFDDVPMHCQIPHGINLLFKLRQNSSEDTN